MSELTAKDVSIFAQVALKVAGEQISNREFLMTDGGTIRFTRDLAAETIELAGEYLAWTIEQWNTFSEKSTNGSKTVSKTERQVY